MYDQLLKTISRFRLDDIPKDRKVLLQPLVDYVSERAAKGEAVNLNFICTHNSRRSHLSQLWAQAAAHHFGVNNVSCYSGGTEATAMYPMIGDTLIAQGFHITKLSEGTNPVYGVKYAAEATPAMVFSKKYDHPLNPTAHFAAVMTCNHADVNCPLIFGAEQRIPVTYVDPKVSDGTDEQVATYAERSIQIGTEMMYVMKNVANHG